MEEFFTAIEAHKATAFCLMVWIWLVASALSPEVNVWFRGREKKEDE